MANEITFSALSSAGGRISSVLSALVRQQLYDATDLRSVMTLIPVSVLYYFSYTTLTLTG